MPNSSTRAYNGINATSNKNAAINNAVNGHDPSYSLSRFLNDMDQKLVPGNDPPRCSDSAPLS
ncbi:hypothetical protein J3E69DRAFT_366969 [Trichoderma sp. SZMC 28015]